MKITAVRAKVYEWKGEVDKPRPHFSGSAMDILYAKAETMATFRFHGWLVVEVETLDGIVGIGNFRVVEVNLISVHVDRHIAVAHNLLFNTDEHIVNKQYEVHD